MNNEHSDRADELIARAAKDYNEPSAVPREEIWTRIVAARQGAPRATRELEQQRRTRLWIWPSAGIAAAALIAVGVAIGRRVERTHIDHVADQAPRSTQQPAPGDSNRSNSAAIAYRLAVLNHLAGSEAMIVSFRASARRGDVDAQLATWSRDLLSETRMLESSAAADDIAMKRLLADLELVIAQIVQYSNHGTHAADDLDLIERSIDRRAVLPKLRSASAGNLPAGT
jgi:hypothetical protein